MAAKDSNVAGLDKTINSQGEEALAALEKTITLAVIDDAWKSNSGHG